MNRLVSLTLLVLPALVDLGRAQQGLQTHTEQQTIGPDVCQLTSFFSGLGFQTDTKNYTVAIPRFDPSLGQLIEVHVRFSSNADNAYCGNLLGPCSIACGINGNVDFQYRLTVPGSSALTRNLFFNQTVTVLQGIIPVKIAYPAKSGSSGTGTVTGSSLSSYTGPGNISFPLKVDFVQQLFPSQSTVFGAFTITTATTVTVDYVYVPFSESYCTAGVSANGCTALMSSSGTASATASSGFTLSASGVEGAKTGIFTFGANGRQASPWGNGTSFRCVAPPSDRGGLLQGTGTLGVCDGSFTQDLNARWCAACTNPGQNPGAGAIVQAQLWYRDPLSTSNQTTSFSDALEFTVAP